MNRRGVRRLAVLACVLLLAGCSGQLPVVSGTGPSTAAGGSLGAGVVVADGHGWTTGGLDGPVPAPGSCHERKAADGEPLPDPACTPGAVDAAVTNTDLSQTVCRKGGYTSSVRPPESLTEPAKRELLAAYGIPESQIRHYELDHLIELNAGGASDIRNLWPEPDTFEQFSSSEFIHNDKDAVEEYTFHALCDQKVTVTAVEQAIAANWTTAVAVLGLPPIPSDYRG